jgi:hypothetical protein
VRDGQTSPHRPRLVVSRSTCPPLSPSPHANSLIRGKHCAEAADGRCLYICMRVCVSMFDVVKPCVSMCVPLRRSMPAGCGVRSGVSMCALRAVRCHAKDPMKFPTPFMYMTKISSNLAYHQPRLYVLTQGVLARRHTDGPLCAALLKTTVMCEAWRRRKIPSPDPSRTCATSGDCGQF